MRWLDLLTGAALTLEERRLMVSLPPVGGAQARQTHGRFF